VPGGRPRTAVGARKLESLGYSDSTFSRFGAKPEHARRITRHMELERKQDETARPPIVRYNIRTKDVEFPSEKLRLDNAASPPPNDQV